MRIRSDDVIVGQPALTIRKLLQQRHGTMTTIVEILHVDYAVAEQIFSALCAEGYIEPSEPSRTNNEDSERWNNTIKGNALANATARRAITRHTAERLLTEFLDRVKGINDCNDYAYRVRRVIIFGSYLSDNPTLGDIDISILLEPRYSNRDERTKHWQKRISNALQNGRNFRNITEEQSWPRLEIFHILKRRSPSISLHDEELEQILERIKPSKILFDATLEKI